MSPFGDKQLQGTYCRIQTCLKLFILFLVRDNNAESVVHRLKSNSMTRIVVVFAERAQVGAKKDSRKKEHVMDHGQLKDGKWKRQVFVSGWGAFAGSQKT